MNKKRRVYSSNWTPVLRVHESVKASFTSLAEQQLEETKTKSPCRRASLYMHGRDPFTDRKQAKRKSEALPKTRKVLLVLSTLLSLLSALATAAGYIIVRDQSLLTESPLSLSAKSALCLASVLQCVLLVSYWKHYTLHQRAIALLFDAPRTKIANFTSIGKCCFECIFHLVMPLPELTKRRTTSGVCSTVNISLDEILYIAVLLRSYHCYRVLFWMSDLATLRAARVFRMRSKPPSLALCTKFYLTRSPLTFALCAYTLMLVISSLSEFVLERSTHGLLTEVANDMWLVAITQTTIGYGDIIPASCAGQVLILISCFFGIFVLGMLNSAGSSTMSLTSKQLTLFNHLVIFRSKQPHHKHSVTLIQRWWRVLSGRRSRTPNGYAVLQFFKQLTLHRTLTFKCRRVPLDTEFSSQVAWFHAATHSKVSRLTDYLRPVVYFQEMVSATQAVDATRKQYQIKTELWRLARRLKYHTLKGPDPSLPVHRKPMKIKLSIVEDSTFIERQSSTGLARSRHSAFLNVMGRLVRDSGSSRSSSPRAWSSAASSLKLEDIED